MANLFLLSFLVVAAGIVFLLYGPTRRGRPIIAVPRASLAKIQLPPAALPISLEPAETIIVDDMIIPEPPPARPSPQARAAAPVAPPRSPTPPPRRHAFVPVVNSKGPLPPLRSRAARGTDSPRRPVADTTPSRVYVEDRTKPHRL